MKQKGSKSEPRVAGGRFLELVDVQTELCYFLLFGRYDGHGAPYNLLRSMYLL